MNKKGFKLYSFFLLSGIILLIGIFFSDVREITLSSEDFKCLKCHKGSKSLPNLVKEKEIKSAEELRFFVRKGPKSGLHITVPEQDLEKAIQYLNLR